MKAMLNFLVGGVLVFAAAGVTWAEPSSDVMNSITAVRLQAARVVGTKQPAMPKDEGVCCRAAPGTRNITAGQSTVAVPVTAFGAK